MADIRLENVTKSYNKKNPVIENLNLTIEDGSFTVLVGPSGCGKSTTLRMIAGLEDITSGKLKIEDNDVTKTDASKRDIAMVFQNYVLYPHMTVRENIEFGLKNKKVVKEKREKLITDVYVTHDQVEAMSMADKIVIMNKGKIMQIGSLKKIYQNPKNLFVAQFIGNPCMNILDIKNDVKFGFRPEKATLESINGGTNGETAQKMVDQFNS
ncbi:ABC transporter ATP-binding protein [Clostridioides sp. ZZV15-6383]|uniref:ABC transporter ATP-binding protein n=1 Tax=unclassified Clostridioides TaxID=2635829 RepID=UPI0039BD1130